MTIEDDISFFERVPTLSLLGRQALRILAIGAETRYIHGGEVLFNAGDEADGAFVIQEGRFVLSSEASERRQGRHGRAVSRCSARSRCSPRPARPATATALEPSTVLRIPRPLFLKMLDSFPDAAREAARNSGDAPRSVHARDPQRARPCSRTREPG